MPVRLQHAPTAAQEFLEGLSAIDLLTVRLDEVREVAMRRRDCKLAVRALRALAELHGFLPTELSEPDLIADGQRAVDEMQRELRQALH